MTKKDINRNLDPDLEVEGVKNVLAQLSDAEKAAMPDDEMPLRHFRAEKGNLEKTVKQIKATLAWREQFQVATLRDCFCPGIDEKEGNAQEEKKESSDRLSYADFRTILLEENATGKIFVRGYDKEGRAVVYMKPGRENTNHETNNMRHLVWNMEKAIAVTRRQGFSKIVFVIDYTGFSLMHAPPLSTSRYTMEIMQRHYPERCYRFYLTNPPFIFKAFWAAVKSFVDPHTKEKIVFCTGAKDMAFLLDELRGDPSRLETFVGGTYTCDYNVRDYFALPFDTALDDDGAFADAVKK